MVFFAEPIQTVLVTSRGHSEIMGKTIKKDNIIAVDWHMPVSFSPKIYAISIGKNRFSKSLIENSKCYAVNFVSYDIKEKVLFCGRNSGIHKDKFAEAGLTKVEGEKIDCPRIKECSAFLECEVIQEIDAGDHIIFIGRILGGEKVSDGNRLFHTTDDDFIKIY